MANEKQKAHHKKHGIVESLLRPMRFIYYKIIRLNSSPEDIARGLAFGVFVGFLPLLPIQTISALFLATLFKGNKFTAAIGTWVSNPLNIVFLYLLYHDIGTALLATEVPPSIDIHGITAAHKANNHDPSSVLVQLFEGGPEFILTMFLGASVIAIPAALATYYFTVRALRLYRAKKHAIIQKRELTKFKKLQESMEEDRKNSESSESNESSENSEKW